MNWYVDELAWKPTKLAWLVLADGLKIILWVYPITFLKPYALC